MKAFRREVLENAAFELLALAKSVDSGITVQDAMRISVRAMKIANDVATWREWFKSRWAAPEVRNPEEEHPF